MPAGLTRTRTVVLAVLAIAVTIGFAAVVAVPAAKDWYQNRHDEAASYRSGKEAKGTAPPCRAGCPTTRSTSSTRCGRPAATVF